MLDLTSLSLLHRLIFCPITAEVSNPTLSVSSPVLLHKTGPLGKEVLLILIEAGS